MLGTMWAAFFGMLFSNHFPVFKARSYNKQITEDSIGVVVVMDEKFAGDIKQIFNDNQAHQVQQDPADLALDRGTRRFWTTVVQLLVFVGVVAGLLLYDVIHIPFPSNMVDQESIGSSRARAWLHP